MNQPPLENLTPDNIVDVIIAQIIKLKPGSTDRFNTENHIIIKEFLYAPINPETQEQQLQQLKHVYFHAPLSSYNENLPDMKFVQDLNLPDSWYVDLPLTDIIFQAFRLSKAPGCSHRLSGHKILCTACNTVFGCKYCHDEDSDHKFDPDNSQIICRYCNSYQPFSEACTACSTPFGTSTCFSCQRTDWRDANALPFTHCITCRTCYRGFPDDNFHCDACKTCFTRKQFDAHRCGAACSVCLQQFCDCQLAYLTPPCGHGIHDFCRYKMGQNGAFSCPICRKFLYELSEKREMNCGFRKLWAYCGVGVSQTNLVNVQCFDCQKVFLHRKTGYYWCRDCDVYNCGEYSGERQVVEGFVEMDIGGEEIVNLLFGLIYEVEGFQWQGVFSVSFLELVEFLKHSSLSVVNGLSLEELVKIVENW